MGLIVKICGLTSLEAMDAALGAGADMVGIMRFGPSPRHVGLETARSLAARAAGRAKRVLVTVDMPDDELDTNVDAIRPDYIQFHGSETPDHVRAAAERTGCRSIKVIGVSGLQDLADAAGYAGVADMLLLDTKPPKDATRPGGHGVAFDWELPGRRRPGLPYLLSGGLDSDNVAEAATVAGAAGVDVSSGVERAPGDKDPAKIRAFVAAARAAEPSRATESLVS